MFNDHTFALSTRPLARPRRSFGATSLRSCKLSPNNRDLSIFHSADLTAKQSIFRSTYATRTLRRPIKTCIFTANPLTTPARPDHWLRSITLLARRPNLFGNGWTHCTPSLNDAISCWKTHNASCQGGGNYTLKYGTNVTRISFESFPIGFLRVRR